MSSTSFKVIPLPFEVIICPLGPIHVIVVGRFVVFSALVAEQVSWKVSPVLATPCARTSTTIAIKMQFEN